MNSGAIAIFLSTNIPGSGSKCNNSEMPCIHSATELRLSRMFQALSRQLCGNLSESFAKSNCRARLCCCDSVSSLL